MQAAMMVPGPTGGSWDIRDVQRPVVPPGQVLLRVRASSINRAEFRRLHNFTTRPDKPALEERAGGGDAAGEIAELGAGVTGFQTGQRAMGRCNGGFAEFALVDARELMAVPDALSFEEAACIPVVFVVVHDALFASGRLERGETLLVTAAPSGVGIAALALGKYLGALVIGTSRSATKLETLKAHGLDLGIVTGADGFGPAIAAAIGDKGVDMIVDNIGGDVLAPCIAALAVGGRFVTIGRMSGVLKGELDVDRLAERRLHLYGVSNRLRSSAQRAESMRRFIADLMPALGGGKIRPIIDRSFALADLAAAQAHVEADRHVGKVVIRV